MTTKSKLTKLSKFLEESGINEANVIVSAPKRNLSPTMDFAMSFPEILYETIEEYDLTMAEFKTLLVLLKLMQFGNIVSINQTTIAVMRGITRQAVSKQFKKFKSVGIIIEDEHGTTWVNPAIFIKGKLYDVKNNQVLYKEMKTYCENLGSDTPF